MSNTDIQWYVAHHLYDLVPFLSRLLEEAAGISFSAQLVEDGQLEFAQRRPNISNPDPFYL